MYSKTRSGHMTAPTCRGQGRSRVQGWMRGMLVRLTIALLLLVASLVPLQATAHPHITEAPDFAAIDRYVQEEMHAVGIPGLALAIVHGDKIMHLEGFGVAGPSGQPVTPQTPFNIASVAKTLTALAIMQLVEADKIHLDAPVQRYLPWFRVADPDASVRITVRHLLNHQSGLPTAVGNDYLERNDTSDAALERRVRALSSAELNRPVGTAYQYSNANYDTLGLIVEVVSGQPYETYVQQHIFAPLEMHHSFPSRHEAQGHSPATGYRLWFGFPVPFAEPVPRPHLPSGRQFSSAEDVAHLLIAYLNEGRYQGTSILSAAGMHTMQTSAVSSGRDCATYSMHWGHDARCDNERFGLGGDDANFKARVLVAPKDKWGVVVLMNTQAISINGPRQEHIEDGVLDLLLGQQPAAVAPHDIASVTIISIIAIVTALLLVGVMRSLVVLRYWRTHPERHPRSWLRLGGRVVVSLLCAVLWVVFLVGVVQVAAGSRSSMPLRFMLENVPDLGWLILVSGTVAISWGVLRVILTVLVLRIHNVPPPRPVPTVGPVHP